MRWKIKGLSPAAILVTATAAAATETSPPIATAESAAVTAAIESSCARTREPIFQRTSLVDHDLAAIEIFPVQPVDRCLHFLRSGHFNKSESARVGRVEFVHHDGRGNDGPKLSKRVLERLVCGIEGEISYVNFRCHRNTLLVCKATISRAAIPMTYNLIIEGWATKTHTGREHLRIPV